MSEERLDLGSQNRSGRQQERLVRGSGLYRTVSQDKEKAGLGSQGKPGECRHVSEVRSVVKGMVLSNWIGKA